MSLSPLGNDTWNSICGGNLDSSQRFDDANLTEPNGSFLSTKESDGVGFGRVDLLAEDSSRSTSDFFEGFEGLLTKPIEQDPKTLEEDSPKLKEIKEFNPFLRNHQKIAEGIVGNNKKALANFLMIEPLNMSGSRNKPWTKEEIEILITLVREVGNCWVEISRRMEEKGYKRKSNTCRLKYKSLVIAKIVVAASFTKSKFQYLAHPQCYIRWREVEQTCLLELMQKYPDGSLRRWLNIAEEMEKNGFKRDRHACRTKGALLMNDQFEKSKPSLAEIVLLFDVIPLFSQTGEPVKWREMQKTFFPTKSNLYLRYLYYKAVILMKKCDPQMSFDERLKEVFQQMQ